MWTPDLRLLTLALVVLGLLWTPASAWAQRAIISVAGPGMAPATDLLDLATGQTARLTNDITDRAAFMPDGTVLLRRVSGEQRWRARFMATGVEITLPDGFGLDRVSPARPIVVAHPREPVVFAAFRNAAGTFFPARVDAGGLRVLPVCGLDESYDSFDLSPDGRLLFVICYDLTSLTVADSATGVEVRRVPLVPGGMSVVVGADGREFLTIRHSGTIGHVDLVRADAVTGDVLHTATVPSQPGIGPGLFANHRNRGRPVLIRCPLVPSIPAFACSTDAVDFQTLALGPQLQSGGPAPPMVSFSADGLQAILSALTFVSRVEMTTGATLNHAPAPANGFVVAAWGAEPQAPVLNAPAVSAGAVSLTWAVLEASAAVTGFRLEVGSQSGANDILTLDVGPTPAFSASGVPAGRYYVRLRAVSANGASGPSNEVIVDVH